MIWIIDPKREESYQIIGINTHLKDGVTQLWGTKPSSKTVLLMQDEDEELITDYADAINYAIHQGSNTFTIK